MHIEVATYDLDWSVFPCPAQSMAEFEEKVKWLRDNTLYPYVRIIEEEKDGTTNSEFTWI